MPLDGLVPRSSPFSASCRCFDDDVEYTCPESTVSTMTTDDGKKILVNKNKKGEIISITAKHKNGHSQSLQAVSPGVLAYIPPGDFDEEVASKFIFKAEELPDRIRRNLRSHSKLQQDRRQLQASCNGQFREIEVAIAVESSFCSKNQVINAGGPDNFVQTLMSDVSAEYEMDGLCFRAVISHYEKFCNPETDPYKEGVDLNQSGCGSTGLLQFFRTYWNSNRQGVRRDVAELFSGTGLECSSQGCVIGKFIYL